VEGVPQGCVFVFIVYLNGWSIIIMIRYISLLSGTYTYPISFAIPHDLPPSLSCDYGSVSYRLMATVHRAGTFAPKVTATQPLTLVSCLGPEATDDLDNIMVQRQWDDQLEYNLHVEGTAFPIGGTIPINITLLPLDKVSIYRITIGLDGECVFVQSDHFSADPTFAYTEKSLCNSAFCWRTYLLTLFSI
jgi:hypothetical protein